MGKNARKLELYRVNNIKPSDELVRDAAIELVRETSDNTDASRTVIDSLKNYKRMQKEAVSVIKDLSYDPVIRFSQISSYISETLKDRNILLTDIEKYFLLFCEMSELHPEIMERLNAGAAPSYGITDRVSEIKGYSEEKLADDFTRIIRKIASAGVPEKDNYADISVLSTEAAILINELYCFRKTDT